VSSFAVSLPAAATNRTFGAALIALYSDCEKLDPPNDAFTIRAPFETA